MSLLSLPEDCLGVIASFLDFVSALHLSHSTRSFFQLRNSPHSGFALNFQLSIDQFRKSVLRLTGVYRSDQGGCGYPESEFELNLNCPSANDPNSWFFSLSVDFSTSYREDSYFYEDHECIVTGTVSFGDFWRNPLFLRPADTICRWNYSTDVSHTGTNRGNLAVRPLPSADLQLLKDGKPTGFYSDLPDPEYEEYAEFDEWLNPEIEPPNRLEFSRLCDVWGALKIDFEPIADETRLLERDKLPIVPLLWERWNGDTLYDRSPFLKQEVKHKKGE